jgi:hypothetical protein
MKSGLTIHVVNRWGTTDIYQHCQCPTITEHGCLQIHDIHGEQVIVYGPAGWSSYKEM